MQLKPLTSDLPYLLVQYIDFLACKSVCCKRELSHLRFIRFAARRVDVSFLQHSTSTSIITEGDFWKNWSQMFARKPYVTSIHRFKEVREKKKFAKVPQASKRKSSFSQCALLRLQCLICQAGSNYPLKACHLSCPLETSVPFFSVVDRRARRRFQCFASQVLWTDQ